MQTCRTHHPTSGTKCDASTCCSSIRMFLLHVYMFWIRLQFCYIPQICWTLGVEQITACHMTNMGGSHDQYLNWRTNNGDKNGAATS